MSLDEIAAAERAAPEQPVSAAPEGLPIRSAWDNYWDSLGKDEQGKLQLHLDSIRAWFSVASAWVGAPLRHEIAALKEENERLRKESAK